MSQTLRTHNIIVSDIYSGLMVFLTKIKVNYLVTCIGLRVRTVAIDVFWPTTAYRDST